MEARETVTVKSCQQAQSTSIIRWTITNVVTYDDFIYGVTTTFKKTSFDDVFFFPGINPTDSYVEHDVF